MAPINRLLKALRIPTYPSATTGRNKKAFTTIALTTHPNKNPQSLTTTSKFQKPTKLYEKLRSYFLPRHDSVPQHDQQVVDDKLAVEGVGRSLIPGLDAGADDTTRKHNEAYKTLAVKPLQHVAKDALYLAEKDFAAKQPHNTARAVTAEEPQLRAFFKWLSHRYREYVAKAALVRQEAQVVEAKTSTPTSEHKDGYRAFIRATLVLGSDAENQVSKEDADQAFAAQEADHVFRKEALKDPRLAAYLEETMPAGNDPIPITRATKGRKVRRRTARVVQSSSLAEGGKDAAKRTKAYIASGGLELRLPDSSKRLIVRDSVTGGYCAEESELDANTNIANADFCFVDPKVRGQLRQERRHRRRLDIGRTSNETARKRRLETKRRNKANKGMGDLEKVRVRR